MSNPATIAQIDYPESDGRPLGETDLHRDWMVHILELLRYRYRGQRVYIASDLLVYYEGGNASRFVVPDNFVVLDCEPGRRKTFKIWEEGKSPDVVFEVTSKATRREDLVSKREIYARLGVQEYYLYDPTAEYLDPPLQGFRLAKDNSYQKIGKHEGRLACKSLRIELALQDDELVMFDAETGEVLLTEAEAERMARQDAQSRIQELEAELARLKKGKGKSS